MFLADNFLVFLHSIILFSVTGIFFFFPISQKQVKCFLLISGLSFPVPIAKEQYRNLIMFKTDTYFS